MFSDEPTLCTDIVINKDNFVSFVKQFIAKTEQQEVKYEGDKAEIYFCYGIHEGIWAIVDYLNLNEEVYDE